MTFDSTRGRASRRPLPIDREPEGGTGHLEVLLVACERIAAAEAASDVNEDRSESQVDVAGELVRRFGPQFSAEHELVGVVEGVVLEFELHLDVAVELRIARLRDANDVVQGLVVLQGKRPQLGREQPVASLTKVAEANLAAEHRI